MSELLNAKQIWLLSYENPLPKRFGREFFRKIPQTPGVYSMLDQNQHILYIGKAKDLRKRLQSYQRIKPDQSARKLIRLVHLIREIRWEECESEKAALLRENHLLRTHRPPFNSLNTHPESYYFLGFHVTRCHFHFRLTTSPEVQEGQLYGAFKGRGLVRQGYGALMRLLWASLAERDEQERFDYPGVLVRRKLPYSYSLLVRREFEKAYQKHWETLVKRFLKGTSDHLLQHLTQYLLDQVTIPPFMYNSIQTDLEILAEFYRYGPHRNRCLRRFHGIKEAHLPQEKIDDLLVTYRLKSS
jgi:excinuclease ABC subunit C